jgi:hypothetical protein
MATVIVSGAIANKYLNGGEAWVRLSWILGLRKLGLRVYFVEQIERENCTDADGALTSFEDCVNRSYFRAVMEEFGLADSATLMYDGGEQTEGLSYPELLDLTGSADLLVNISGHLSSEPLMQRLRCKVYVDLDPGFTQFWHAAGNEGARLAGHHHYFSTGENLGTPACRVPTQGLPWRPIPPPVVLDEWPATNGGSTRFTTVATWRGPFGPVSHEGTTFGLKVHQFRKMIELPERVPYEFEIALGIYPDDSKDLDALHAHGWQIVDPKQAVPDPASFRSYVQRSGAEFSVAQGVYVDTEVGWFSDRTVRYLASGKPTLVQDTGFTRSYPVGEGLLAFRTLEEAVAGAERIMADYESHRQAARALAEEYFDSDKVLGRFLAEVGVA